MCTTVSEWSSEDSSRSGFALGIELSCQVWQQAPVKPLPQAPRFPLSKLQMGARATVRRARCGAFNSFIS